MSEKALIAMSGGVDSSAAAAVMIKAGYECIGATMRLHNEGADICSEKSCCSVDDCEDARSAAYKLGMSYYVFNMQEDFRTEVIERFVSAYEKGLTPNPCIDCNRYMKFDKLLKRADILGCQLIATGHYARVEFDENRGRWLLKKAACAAKDQTYVLYSLTQEQLARTRFPLGDFESKDAVREFAAGLGFNNAHKHDSQDICFVPDGDYASFIERFRSTEFPEGDFISADGEILGRHSGVIRYTIGQRKGLGLSFGKPMYVCAKSVENNTVTIADESALFSSTLTANDFNWISCEAPSTPIRVTAKTRYRAKEAPAYAVSNPDGTVTVTFDEPQRAIAAGQAVVLYDGDIVVGGGTII